MMLSHQGGVLSLLSCLLGSVEALHLPKVSSAASHSMTRRELSSCAALAALTVGTAASAADAIIVTTLAEGDTSSPTPQRAQKAVVDYTLWINGFEEKMIDTSKGKLLPIPRPPSPFVFSVGVGEVIPGWDRTVREMHVGEKRRVVIPASLGYGAKGIGPIPGGAALYFEIELLELKPMPQLSEKHLEWLASHPER